MSPKISVVMPVYNVEKYLAECLKSVLGQSYRDIEVICINDGSTDNSPKVLKDFAARDKRIVLISQDNAGVSVARNKGISVASGEYLCFIDSDDIWHPQFLESMISALLETESDVVWSEISFFKEQEHPIFQPISAKNYTLFENPFLSLLMGRVHSSVVNKLYRTETVKNIPFPTQAKIAEDSIWTHKVIAATGKGVGISYPPYYARLNPNSATRKPDVNAWVEGHIVCIRELSQYFSNKPITEDARQKLNRKLVRMCLKHICKAPLKLAPGEYRLYWKKYAPQVAEMFQKSIISYRGIGFKNRLKMGLFIHGKFTLLKAIINL